MNIHTLLTGIFVILVLLPIVMGFVLIVRGVKRIAKK